MSDTPEVVAICLCERVLQDIFRRDAVTLVNVHNLISSHAFPTLVPIVYVYAQLRGLQQGFTYKFKILSPKGEEITSSTEGQVEPLPNSATLHKLISAFSGLVFPSEGTYTVVLEIDKVQVSSMPITVELVPVIQPAGV